MKKLILYCLLLQLISCASNRIEGQITEDFFTAIITEKNSEKVIILEESAPKIKALEFYEKAFLERKKSDYYSRKIVAKDYTFNSWPIDSLEIDHFKLQLKQEAVTPRWETSDFKNQTIIKKKESIETEFSKGALSLNTQVYFVSKPLVSRDKKYALIFYCPFGYFHGGKADERVVLMKKSNEKWVVETYFYDPNIMN